MAKRNYPRPAEPVAQEPVVVETAEPVNIVGVVIDCDRLNVRKAPNTSATVVCTIGRGEEVTIDEEKSKREFYKVRLASGIEGYCMKKYIAVQK